MNLKVRGARRSALALFGIVVAPFALHAEALTPEAAEQVYRQAMPPLGPGCYRKVQGNDTTYEQVLADGTHWTRTESPLRRDGVQVRRVRLRNAEGTWIIFDQVAVLEPPPSLDDKKELVERHPEAGKIFKDMEQAAKAEHEKLAQMSPEERQRAAAAMRPTWSGERTRDASGADRVCVRQTFSPEMLKRLGAMFDLVLKQIPFFLRPLVKPHFAEFREKMPMTTEWIIDPEKNRLLLMRTFSAKGVLLEETVPAAWEPCEAGDRFVVPDQLRSLRPKGRREFARLEHKYEAEQIAAAKKARRDRERKR